MDFFSFQNSHFNIIWHKICMVFYLLRWTYFNDVNVGRNIMSSNKKKWRKSAKDRKNMEKENNTDKWDTIFKLFEAFWI